MTLRFAEGKNGVFRPSSPHYTFFALSLLTMFSFPQYSAAEAMPAASQGFNPQNEASYTMQAEAALYDSSPLALPALPAGRQALSSTVHIISRHDTSGQMWIVITAYSSTPDQTDGNPFITANGTHVRDGIIAANFLPFGTKVRFPTLYGDKIFVVEDRMNSRYSYHADIWMQTRQEAKNFGAQIAPIEIVNS